MEELQVVRNYKDTVFRMIFRKPRELLSLYNALNGTAHTDEGSLEVNTLENAVYMAVKNDVSMILDSEMNLYEQQSNFSPNMPLRDLIYIAKQLEKYCKDRTLYSGSPLKIPLPRFVVFYNGTVKQPERQILKLSDSFEKKTEDPELELKVLMLNINLGCNDELLQKCKSLKEYCEYVACIRKYVKECTISEAVEKAVRECIGRGILADFLQSQRAEVVAMSIFEYNEEEEMKKIRAAEYDYGWEIGNMEGIRTGKAEGKVEGKAEGVLDLLKDLGQVPEKVSERILQENDLELLGLWLKKAAKAESLEEFIREL